MGGGVPQGGRYTETTSRWLTVDDCDHRALLVVDDQEYVSHDPHDDYRHVISFVRVDPEGRLWWVGATGRTEGAASEPQCFARRYRFVGDRAVRGDAPGCRLIHLEGPPRRRAAVLPPTHGSPTPALSPVAGVGY